MIGNQGYKDSLVTVCFSHRYVIQAITFTIVEALISLLEKTSFSVSGLITSLIHPT
jgi:hypothetical protein